MPTATPCTCSIREEKVAQAIGAEDKEKIEKALHEAMEWLDANQTAEVGADFDCLEGSRYPACDDVSFSRSTCGTSGLDQTPAAENDLILLSASRDGNLLLLSVLAERLILTPSLCMAPGLVSAEVQACSFVEVGRSQHPHCQLNVNEVPITAFSPAHTDTLPVPAGRGVRAQAQVPGGPVQPHHHPHVPRCWRRWCWRPTTQRRWRGRRWRWWPQDRGGRLSCCTCTAWVPSDRGRFAQLPPRAHDGVMWVGAAGAVKAGCVCGPGSVQQMCTCG